MYEYNAKLDRIIDGDTVDALIDLGFDIWIKKRIRLYGIDAPETRTRDLEEKSLGFAAKERLEELLEASGGCLYSLLLVLASMAGVLGQSLSITKT